MLAMFWSGGDLSCPPPASLRFAVLEHTGMGPDHWDLLLELKPGAALSTWRLEADPTREDACGALRLADHRAAYLSYEGPVSGGRGAVRRVAGGVLEVHRATPDLLQGALNGGDWKRTFALQRQLPGAPVWRLRLAALPA